MTMQKLIDLSISIASFNNSVLLKKCLKSIFTTGSRFRFEVLLTDNGSADDSVKMVKAEFPSVKINQNKRNEFFSKAHNQNLKKVTGRYFLVLNEDTQFKMAVLGKMIKFMDKNPQIGLLSCRGIDLKGKTDLTCSPFPHPLFELSKSSLIGRLLFKSLLKSFGNRITQNYSYPAWKRNSNRKVDIIPGSFMLGRASLLKEVGFFDENCLLFYEEADYCKRAFQKGYISFHFGELAITHLKSKGVEKIQLFERYKISEHDMLYYYKKYYGLGWFILLWFIFRPDWLYWRLKSIL